MLTLFLVASLFGCGLRPAPPVHESPPLIASPSPERTIERPLEMVSPSPTPTPTRAAAEPASSGKVAATVAPARHKREPLVKPSYSNLALELPLASSATGSAESLKRLRNNAEYEGSAGSWRKLADAAVEAESFSVAHEAYSKEAAIYRSLGHTQAAIAEEIKARKYATESGFYVSVSAPKAEQKLERLEPARGCYVGAFIDRDDSLEKKYFQSQLHGDIPQFNDMVQKPHSSFFMYRSYGKPFPKQWAEYCKENGAIPHIAWEPRSLEEVKDDDYLHTFIEEAAQLDHPVILRFASEMNGEWTRYHGDPAAYKKMFRMVYQATRKAPKVALMWCPNSVPQKSIKDYYPGDDSVDWVGVNFYSVPFLDNDPKRPGDLLYPTDHLRYVYETYSKKKPIAVGEWAASQASALSEKPLTDFGITKMSQLYATIPLRYPRVKMVNWYDCNNLIQAKSDRRLNNFQLTKPQAVLEAYQRAVSNRYYLSPDKVAPFHYKAVEKSFDLGPSDEFRLWLKSYDPTLKVYFQVGDKVVQASDDPLNWYLTGEQLRPYGKGLLVMKAYDSKDREVCKLQMKFKVNS